MLTVSFREVVIQEDLTKAARKVAEAKLHASMYLYVLLLIETDHLRNLLLQLNLTTLRDLSWEAAFTSLPSSGYCMTRLQLAQRGESYVLWTGGVYLYAMSSQY